MSPPLPQACGRAGSLNPCFVSLAAMGEKSSNNLKKETLILLMVSKVQSMASISELMEEERRRRLFTSWRTGNRGDHNRKGQDKIQPQRMSPRTGFPLPGSTFESGHLPQLFSSAVDQRALGHAPRDLVLSGDTGSSTLRAVLY